MKNKYDHCQTDNSGATLSQQIKGSNPVRLLPFLIWYKIWNGQNTLLI